MTQSFGGAAMAVGYARSRPPLHERIVQLATRSLRTPVGRAVDVGCGAGLSTRALAAVASQRFGIEPVSEMLRFAPDVAPGCDFVTASAERLPFRTGRIDIIAAAGSLNYVDLKTFFPEAIRVLSESGVLVVYDFSAGKRFSDYPGLEDWFQSFVGRYPRPSGDATFLDVPTLEGLANGFTLESGEGFSMTVPMSRVRYTDYMLTETNVSAAVVRGVDPGEIRQWCEKSLSSVWPGGEDREIVFSGYFAVLRPTVKSR